MSKLLLNPPGKDAPAIVRSLWLASGPGRAWVILEWARGIDKRDTRYALVGRAKTPRRYPAVIFNMPTLICAHRRP